MKFASVRYALGLMSWAVFVLAGIAPAQDQSAQIVPRQIVPRYTVLKPEHPVDAAAYGRLGRDGKALPTWGALFKYKTQFYGFYMVGSDPTLGSATSDIEMVIVPVVMKFSDGTVLDPTAPVQCNETDSALTITQQSPILNSIDWVQGGTDVGTTQYPDAFQRAEWWNFANGSAPDYHVMLDPVIAPTVTIRVPGRLGSTHGGRGCGVFGDVDGLFFDSQLKTIMLKTKLQPNQFPYFLTYDVVEDHGVLGYHSTFNNIIYAAGTYSDQNFGPNHAYQDMVSMSHVIGAAFNDPFGDNLTPDWKSPLARGCESLLEAGDPLAGLAEPVSVPGNAHQYYVQDLAFELWFARGRTSSSVNGWFSMFGTFTSSAGNCN